uniref:Uncharacterized protein n=1 Tax=Leptobrachium leishanense TaxID=445787 RepID=A0A8C5Q841_9ANUR
MKERYLGITPSSLLLFHRADRFNPRRIQIVSGGLKGRVFEVNLADLQNDE